jgi:hypothetical protein
MGAERGWLRTEGRRFESCRAQRRIASHSAALRVGGTLYAQMQRTSGVQGTLLDLLNSGRTEVKVRIR